MAPGTNVGTGCLPGSSSLSQTLQEPPQIPFPSSLSLLPLVSHCHPKLQAGGEIALNFLSSSKRLPSGHLSLGKGNNKQKAFPLGGSGVSSQALETVSESYLFNPRII